MTVNDLTMDDLAKVLIGQNGESLTDGLFAVAYQMKYLGNGDAATPMGGMEALGKCMLDASARLAEAISDLANAIYESNSLK